MTMIKDSNFTDKRIKYPVNDKRYMFNIPVDKRRCFNVNRNMFRILILKTCCSKACKFLKFTNKICKKATYYLRVQKYN